MTRSAPAMHGPATTIRGSVLKTIWLAFALAGCSHHPLAGGWTEVRADGKEGYALEFNADGEHLTVHGRPRADDTHDHLHGTYRLEGADLTLEWADDLGNKTALRGRVAGDDLVLATATGEKLAFRRGAAAHH